MRRPHRFAWRTVAGGRTTEPRKSPRTSTVQVRCKKDFRPSTRKSCAGGGVRLKNSSRAVRRALFHLFEGFFEGFWPRKSCVQGEKSVRENLFAPDLYPLATLTAAVNTQVFQTIRGEERRQTHSQPDRHTDRQTDSRQTHRQRQSEARRGEARRGKPRRGEGRRGEATT